MRRTFAIFLAMCLIAFSLDGSEAWRRRRAGMKLRNRERGQEISDRTDAELKAELDTDLRTEVENDPEVELGTVFENDSGDTSLRSWSEFKTELETEFENDPEAELGTEYENDAEVELGTEFENDQEVELGTKFKDHEDNYKYYDKEVA